MSLQQTTPVPNLLFDFFLPDLKEVELKVLLVVIRKTLGWVEKKNNRQRKQIERISVAVLSMNSGCSRRAISGAIQSLIDKKLLIVYDSRGNKISDPDVRKGKFTLYFQPVLKYGEINQIRKNVLNAKAESSLDSKQILPNTNKETELKKDKENTSHNSTSIHSSNPHHIINHINRIKYYE